MVFHKSTTRARLKFCEAKVLCEGLTKIVLCVVALKLNHIQT